MIAPLWGLTDPCVGGWQFGQIGCFGMFFTIWMDLGEYEIGETAIVGPKRPRVGTRLTIGLKTEFSCDSESGVKQVPTFGRDGSEI